MISGTYSFKGFTTFRAFSLKQYNNQHIPTPTKITHERLPTLLKRILALQAIGLAVLTTFPDAKTEEANRVTAYRASILHFTSDPLLTKEKSYEYIKDGLLIVRNGHVILAELYESSIRYLSKTAKVINYSGYLITPGFIDAHVHYPQVEIIASYGEQLLEWLNTYVFPAERKYSNSQYARGKADFFLNQLMGTSKNPRWLELTTSPAIITTSD
ncbi:MAG: amidohydrolase family protein [Cyanobacteria bacterium K_DeepCast_35m_m2_023]|nr:amidohydrolase family protein [Cyanobacteria bacterium K_DeepCast_35m_m2_023]